MQVAPAFGLVTADANGVKDEEKRAVVIAAAMITFLMGNILLEELAYYLKYRSHKHRLLLSMFPK